VSRAGLSLETALTGRSAPAAPPLLTPAVWIPGSFPGVVETRGRARWRGDLTPRIRWIPARPSNRSPALAVATELLRDWASPFAEPARDVIYRYFTESPNLSGEVGVAEAERLAATAYGAH
jgi:hypothetical protein